ncbi:MAG: hypothetical protein PVG66_16785, partial [Chromatiales bacterium]
MGHEFPHQGVAGRQALLQSLAIYFRDFLDSDFKKERLPKRKLTRKDRENRLTGIPLARYSQFTQDLWQLLEQPVSAGFQISVSRGQYSLPPDEKLSGLISQHIQAISEQSLEALAIEIDAHCRQAFESPEKNAEQRINRILNYIEKQTGDRLVQPLLDELGNSINLHNVADTRQELIDLVVGQEEEVLRAGLAENNAENFASAVQDLFDPQALRAKLQRYFAGFASADLYTELQDIHNTIKQIENCQLYLNICDIKYQNHRY